MTTQCNWTDVRPTEPPTKSLPDIVAVLGATVILLPLEHSLPTVAGFSTILLLIGLLAVVCVVQGPSVLVQAATQRMIVLGYLLVGYGAAAETFHFAPSNDYVLRSLQFFVGVAIVGAAIGVLKSLRPLIWSVIVMGTWLSTYLLLTKYSLIAGASVASFDDASQLRADAFTNDSLGNNLNALSFLAAIGAVTTFALAISAERAMRRIIFLALSGMQSVASTLVLSRDGALILAVGFAVVLWRTQGSRFRRLAVAVAVAGVGHWALPQAVLARLQLNPEVGSGKLDARTVVWNAAVDNVGDYIWRGVGENAFVGEWGASHGFSRSGVVLGAHNTFVQVTILWGIGALALLVAVAWVAWNMAVVAGARLPALESTLVVVWVAMFVVRLAFTHTLYDKSFVLLLGGVLGAYLCVRERSASAGSAQRHAASSRRGI